MHTLDEEALIIVTARFFKGLGEPVRLQILEFLATGKNTVTEIVEHLGLPHRDDTEILSVEDAFKLGRHAWSSVLAYA